MIELLIPLFAATVQSGTPLVFATLGEMMTEKSGILNLGVEGMMSVAALAAFVTAFSTGSAWLGMLAGGMAGLGMGLIHGFVCISCLGNQVVSGLALTIFGLGLTTFLGTPFIGSTISGFGKYALPFLCDIPKIGDIFFRQDALVYISYLCPVLFWFFFRYTSFGLNITATGEHPPAAAAAGLKPNFWRYFATAIGGFLIGLGGAYLSLAYTHSWTNGLSSGRGWIAVALVIFAFWKPGRAVVGAYLFGGVMAFQLRLQASGTNLPSSLLLMLPYALTILVLILSAFRGHKAQAPAALGTNIEPEN